MKYPRNKAASDAIAFVESLTLVGDYGGKPVKLAPFQREIIATLFGTLDRAKRRKIKKAVLFLPRKSAKTFICACIILYWLVGRGLKGQHCLSVANDVSQAALLYDMLAEMVRNDAALDAEQGGCCELYRGTKTLTVPLVNSYYRSLSTTDSTKTGFSPSLVVCDEMQDILDPKLLRKLTSGRTARDDYLTVYIGTAGERKDTQWWLEYEYAKKWLAGEIENDAYYAMVCESPEEDDWHDEKTWAYHPAWGVFCKPQNVRDDYKLAKDNPAEEIKFKQFYLNRWQTYAGISWLPDAEWMANSDKPLGDAVEYYAGLDKASVLDTTSLVLFGLNSQGKWDVIPFVWCCEKQVEDRVTADFDYRQWARAGYLRVTAGSAQDEKQIVADIRDIINRYPVRMFSIDPAGTSYMAAELEAMGYKPGSTLVGFSQAIKSMSEPIKEIEKLVRERQLCHGGHPVARWMVNNVKLVTDGKDNYGFSKKASKDKIDFCSALACAVGVAIPAIAEASCIAASPWDDPGYRPLVI